jgi:hypothetical protein
MASANGPVSLGLDPTDVPHDEHVPHDTIMTSLELNKSAIETERDVSDMLQRCQLLLDELEQFQLYLKQQKKDNGVEKFHTFKSHVQNEMRLLDNVGIILLLLETVVNAFTAFKGRSKQPKNNT